MRKLLSLKLRIGAAIGIFLVPWILFFIADYDTYPFSTVPMYSFSILFGQPAVLYNMYHIYPDGRKIRLKRGLYLWPRPAGKLTIRLKALSKQGSIDSEVEKLISFYQKKHIKIFMDRPPAERPRALVLRKEDVFLEKKHNKIELVPSRPGETLKHVDLIYE